MRLLFKLKRTDWCRSLLEERAEVDPCFVFTRVTQSSHTKRYKGGTAPRLWKFCAADENPEAELFSGSYIGTSEVSAADKL